MKALQFIPPGRDVNDLLERLLDRVESEHETVENLATEMDLDDVVRDLDLSDEKQLLGELRQKSGDAVELQRQRILGKILDELYFRVLIEPGVGTLLGTSTIAATGFSWEDFPPLVVTARRRTVRMPALWPRCRTRLNLWYTSSVGSTNTFNIRFNVRQLATGMLVTAPALLFSDTFTVPGPAVANTVLFATYRDPTPWLPAPELAVFSILRAGPDANLNDFRFIAAEFVLEEAA